MLAAANVELVIDEGCLRMWSADGHLIIWPQGFSLATKDDGIQILNETGLMVACVGEKVSMSGGQLRSFRHTGDYVLRHLPASCSGSYWIVGSVFTLPPRDNPYNLSSE